MELFCYFKTKKRESLLFMPRSIDAMIYGNNIPTRITFQDKSAFGMVYRSKWIRQTIYNIHLDGFTAYSHISNQLLENECDTIA